MNESSLENMITLMDREGDGRVSEFEFLVYVMTNTGLAKRDTLEEIHRTFLALDRDGSGKLNRDDLREKVRVMSTDSMSALDLEQGGGGRRGGGKRRKRRKGGGEQCRR